MPAIQQFAAHATHWALYALLIVQPMLGWIATSAYPRAGAVFLAVRPAADLAGGPRLFRNDVPGRTAGHRHRDRADRSALHIAGALYHHFVRKDRVLMRMVTG